MIYLLCISVYSSPLGYTFIDIVCSILDRGAKIYFVI